MMIFCALFSSGAPQSVRLHGSVIDENGKPVTDVEVKIQLPSGQIETAYTNISGVFEFSFEAVGEYRASLNKTGFFRMAESPITLNEGHNAISLSINHETEMHERIEVYSSAEIIKPLSTSHERSLIAREIRDIPVPSTHDLRSSLEVLPEVIADHSGQLHIAGGRTSETQYLLDGFDIGDPVTGSLSMQINVDSVRIAEVESGCFGAQHGGSGAGLLSIDTIEGDDRWRAGATDFLPGFSVDRGVHFSSWRPRFTISGPISKRRAWFSDALSLQRTLSLVRELPRNANTVTQWAGDNMFRTQVKLSPKNMLQGSFLYNQRNASNLGLGPFSPESTTRGFQAYRSFVSIKEQVWSERTFYELGLAADIGHDETLPYGFEPYIVTPNGSAGNYFESLRRQTRRWQGFGSVTLPARHWRGAHDLQFGFNATTKGWTQSSQRNDIEVQRADGSVVQRTVYSGQPYFHLSDTYLGVYAHDTWRVLNALVLQFSLRTDWERLLQRTAASPRVSANFLPFHNERSKFSIAWGVYLQPLALSSIGPAYDQQRSDTFYNRDGYSSSSATSRFVLPDEHLKQARFYAFSAGWEQSIGGNSQAGISFTKRNERLGLAFEKAAASPNLNLFLLQNSRRDSYRSVQISFRHLFNDRANVSFNFTRSNTRTNRIFDYSLESPVFSPQESGPLSWDAPNRFISSGWTPTRFWGLFLSYFFEYRSGFPFSRVNEQQQLVGPANGMRFPDYTALNFGVEKHIRLFTRTWAVRFTILNATGHSNSDNVINNVDSPNFMKFGGSQKRAFNARVRLVG
jgi:hypothetical protein